PGARRPRHRAVLLCRASDLFARRSARQPLPAAYPRRSALSAAGPVRDRDVGGILPPPQLLPGRGAHDPDVSLSATARLPDLEAAMKWLSMCALLSLMPASAVAQEVQPAPQSRLWIVAGGATTTLRGHCQDCGQDFPFRHGG